MSDEMLREAADALRSLPVPSSERQVNDTRARIMSSLHEGRRRRHVRWTFALPLAAIFIGSTAWAGASGKLPAIVATLKRVFIAPAGEPVQQPVLKASATATKQLERPRQAPPPAEPAPALQAELSELEPTPSARHQMSKQAHARPVTQEEPVARVLPAPTGSLPAAKGALSDAAAVDAEPGVFELYKSAHQAHFARHDCEAATRGYEAYLKAAPKGRFRLEASYNRALCLIRLGRREQARRALRPFAEGRLGSYRQVEAQRLLEALGEQQRP